MSPDTAITSEPEGIRDAIMSLYDLVRLGQSLSPDIRQLRGHLSFARYALSNPSRKRRTLMDVPTMVERWVESLIVLSTAHDKAGLDHVEYGLDDLMAPLLTAPVAQLRQFYAALLQALKADTRVPLFLWAMFEAWGEIKVKDAPDQGIRELKTALAQEIAELVEQDVQPDIMAAIVGALQWRDPATLTKVRDAVQAGAKPRLQGRESCLFLMVAGEQVML